MKHSAKFRSSREITRREFVARTMTTAGVNATAPAILRGQNLNNFPRPAVVSLVGLREWHDE